MTEFEDTIVLGLAGQSASGKTATAEFLAGHEGVLSYSESTSAVSWVRLFFALPLYEMARIRTDIEGENARDRMMYEIHRVLTEIWPSPLTGGPPYNTLVSMVNQIVALPIDTNGKPRHFLQTVGTDICRPVDANCFPNWMTKQMYKEYSLFSSSVSENMQETASFGIVIDDCRFPNEAESILNKKNSVLIKLIADDEVRKMRQIERDGFAMKENHSNHKAETSIEEIPLEWYDAIIDTTNLTIEEQTERVLMTVEDKIGKRVRAHA